MTAPLDSSSYWTTPSSNSNSTAGFTSGMTLGQPLDFSSSFNNPSTNWQNNWNVDFSQLGVNPLTGNTYGFSSTPSAPAAPQQPSALDTWVKDKLPGLATQAFNSAFGPKVDYNGMASAAGQLSNINTIMAAHMQPAAFWTADANTALSRLGGFYGAKDTLDFGIPTGIASSMKIQPFEDLLRKKELVDLDSGLAAAGFRTPNALSEGLGKFGVPEKETTPIMDWFTRAMGTRRV